MGKSMFVESENNLAWVRQEFDRQDKDAAYALRQLGDEVRMVDAALIRAVSEEALLSRKLAETVQRQKDARNRISKEMDESRRSASILDDAREKEHDLRRCLGREPVTLRGGYALDDAQEDALEHENSQLRNMLSQQGRSSAGLSALHDKLESHIQRLQQHTEELRSSLQGGSPPRN